jgi:ribonuclease P protein component
MSQEYPRSRRITRRSEFLNVGTKGRRVRALDLDVRWLASPSNVMRAGVIVPRYGHTAVVRNKLKRRLRELVRSCLLPMNLPLDVVVRARPTAYERTFSQLHGQVEQIQLGLQTQQADGPKS